ACIWDAGDGKLLATLQSHTNWVRDIKFSSDGQRVATSSQGTVKLWEAAGSRLLTTLHGEVNAFATTGFSPDGRLFVAKFGGKNPRVSQVFDSVRVLDAASGNL